MGLTGTSCSTFAIWENGIAFLTELFNLSIAGYDIPAIWKNSVIIPILKAGKPQEQAAPTSQSRSSARSEDLEAGPTTWSIENEVSHSN